MILTIIVYGLISIGGIAMVNSIHRRNVEFKEKMANTDKRKVVGVAIDTSKYFHRVLIFDFQGKFLTKPFSIDNLQKGYDKLKISIRKATRKRKTDNIYIAVELAGVYSDNLIRHLAEDFENIVLVTGRAVKENRDQQSLYGLKTDDIDAGAVADLLIRGEFIKFYDESVDYRYLRELVHWREKKVRIRIKLKNQIVARMDRIYPGLNNDFDTNKKLYCSNLSSLYQGLTKVSMTPKEIMGIPDIKLAKLLGYKKMSHMKKVREFKVRLKEMMFADDAMTKRNLKLLKRDVSLLEHIKSELKEVEEEIVEISNKTPARYLVGEIKGITELTAGIFIGLIGDIKKYASANHIFSSAGLSPRISESGRMLKSKGKGIKRYGNKVLRTRLFQMARQVLMCDPYFESFYKRQKMNKKKHWKKRCITVANKLNRVMFALMRDKVQFKRI